MSTDPKIRAGRDPPYGEFAKNFTGNAVNQLTLTPLIPACVRYRTDMLCIEGQDESIHSFIHFAIAGAPDVSVGAAFVVSSERDSYDGLSKY